MHKKLYPRLTSPPRDSFFLFGARGVGKSTWARERFPGAHRIDLLDEGLYQSLLADPSLFAGMLRARPEESRVVVDEVQRIPGLLNEIHRFIEERGLRFALLGSSARKLKTAGTNLLAGRALWKTMFPLVPEELGSDFDSSSTRSSTGRRPRPGKPKSTSFSAAAASSSASRSNPDAGSPATC